MQQLKTLQQVIQRDLFRNYPLLKEPIRKERGGIPVYRTNRLLLDSAKRMQSLSLNEMFARDPGRADRFTIETAGLSLDFSKNRLDSSVMDQLLSLAEEAELPQAIQRLYRGELVNNTELQPALHTALRDFSEQPAAGVHIQQQVMAARQQMLNFAERLRAGRVTGFSGKVIRHVVVIGIGGSYLGPKLVCEALKDYIDTDLSIDFVASLDPDELFDLLADLELEQTLFVVSSKSFGTVETLTNATVIKELLANYYGTERAVQQQMVAVTASPDRALEFGVADDGVFPLWSWVGGRYSLWSSIGLPIAIAIGRERFTELLKGAWQMDCHFRHAPMAANMPVVMALVGIWNRNYLKSQSLAVLPYSHRLRSLPEFLQQLDMESNGKSVTTTGEPVKWATGPIVWGGMGNLGQHAYYQLMHQGNDAIAADFILCGQVGHEQNKETGGCVRSLQNSLLSNAIGQSKALMQGRSLSQVRQQMFAAGRSTKEIRDVEAHQVIAGSRPSNILYMERVTPSSLGALLALYEAKVYAQSVIWKINAFDQWSVELGKGIAKELLPALEGEGTSTPLDTSTQNLINRLSKQL